jgi:hypothetical protein
MARAGSNRRSNSEELSSIYTYAANGFTVILYGQRENASVPVYDGFSPITGALIPESTVNRLSGIDLKVCGYPWSAVFGLDVSGRYTESTRAL